MWVFKEFTTTQILLKVNSQINHEEARLLHSLSTHPSFLLPCCNLKVIMNSDIAPLKTLSNLSIWSWNKISLQEIKIQGPGLNQHVNNLTWLLHPFDLLMFLFQTSLPYKLTAQYKRQQSNNIKIWHISIVLGSLSSLIYMYLIIA